MMAAAGISSASLVASDLVKWNILVEKCCSGHGNNGRYKMKYMGSDNRYKVQRTSYPDFLLGQAAGMQVGRDFLEPSHAQT